MESIAVADEHEYAVEWSHNRDDDAGRSSRDRRPGAEADDNMSQLLDRQQQLKVCDTVHVFWRQGHLESTDLFQNLMGSSLSEDAFLVK